MRGVLAAERLADELTIHLRFGTLDRMPRAYFDANIYDHIARGYIPADEVDAIRGPLERHQIVGHLSLADIDELLGDWETNRPSAVRRLQVARDLVGFDSVVTQPSDLLREAIESYAAGRPEPSPLLNRDHQELVSGLLDRVAAGEDSADLDSMARDIVRGVRELKGGFRRSAAEARHQTLAELKWETRDPEERRSVTFEAFWQGNAAYWAEVLADGIGLAEQCRERGIEGLLRLRPVRLAVGAWVSLVFALSVPGDGPQSRQPHDGDFYDIWHALLASGADVFVTRDGRLAKSLARVPIEGFQVVTSLSALLDASR